MVTENERVQKEKYIYNFCAVIDRSTCYYNNNCTMTTLNFSVLAVCNLSLDVLLIGQGTCMCVYTLYCYICWFSLSIT